MTDLSFHPLTPDRWDDFVALFETDSICRMCWCVYHRLPASIRRETNGKSRKTAMAKIVKAGPPPGLLAYKGKEAIGWLAVAPRPATPDWNVGRKASAAEQPEDATDESVWAATCFFVRKDARGEGVTSALLEAGTAWAKKHGAKRLEACPMAHEEKRSTSGLFVGPKRVFDRAGFSAVIERKPGRPLVRLELKKPKNVGWIEPEAKSTIAPRPRKVDFASGSIHPTAAKRKSRKAKSKRSTR